MKYMDITPEIAQNWLANNNHNNYRQYQSNYAKFLGRKMSNGFWQRNGVPIVFDTNGELKDGQHRLGGVVESGFTLKDWPVEYVDPSVTVFDMGRNRTWKEYTYAANHGKAVNTSIGGAISCLLGNGNADKIASEERLQFYWQNEELLDKSCLYATRGTNHGMMKKGGCIAAVFCAMKINMMPENDIEVFCRSVNTGFPVDGYACESPLALRKTLTDGLKIKAGGRNAQAYCFEVTWQALEAFKRGLRSKRLFKPDGKCAEIIRNAMKGE